MNAEFVTVGVHDNRCPAGRKVERLKGELHVVVSEMFYCLVEVVHFQHPEAKLYDCTMAKPDPRQEPYRICLHEPTQGKKYQKIGS